VANSLTITLPDYLGIPIAADDAERLLDAIAGSGLSAACEAPGSPSRRTVLRWAREVPSFRSALDAAVGDYAQRLLDEAIEAADSAEDKESAACARVKADVRLKVAAMIAPRVYGRDAGAVDVGGVVVNLIRLAAQGMKGIHTLESEPLKPQTRDDSAYTQHAANAERLALGGTGVYAADPGVGTNGSRDTDGGGAPATPVPPFSPGPTHNPGVRPKTTYTQTAVDRITITVEGGLEDDDPDFFREISEGVGPGDLTPAAPHEIPDLPE
jgi:hypothetical protein